MKRTRKLVPMRCGGGLFLILFFITAVGTAAPTTSLPVSSGLRLWLRSDMGIALDASGNVQTWADQSSFGNDFTQGTASARPALTAGAGPGGANVLHFDGLDDVLQNPAQLVAGTSLTVFTVVAVREPGYPWTLGTSVGGGPLDPLNQRFFYEGHPGGDVTGPDYFDVNVDWFNGVRATFPGINDTQYKVLTMTGSGTIHNVRVFVNGAPAVMTLQEYPRDLIISAGNTLGFVHTTPEPFTESDFAEFIVYDRELNETERQSVETYLVSRYFTPVLEVAVDIKPGGFPNSINPRSKGVIPVAILTTGTFDASTVDPTTVRFGATGTEAAPAHVVLEDVDRDGDTDMILHFNTQATGILCGNTSASLTGQTVSGQAIHGSDSVSTVGCK